jgi:DNA-binding GntR family transcriptional regulator
VTHSHAPRNRNRREDRTTHAYQRLRELIVHGRLAPGTWIIESDVAGRLGVSRTPVRAALQRLEQEGYIVGTCRGQQVRSAVAPLTREDAHELFVIVGQLEGLAAAEASRLPAPARDALIAELHRLNDGFRAAASEHVYDPSRLFELDTAFHRRFVEAAAGPRVHAHHDAIKPQAERYIRLYYTALIDEVVTSAREHGHIIDAIGGGDPTTAKEAVEVNWSNAAERLNRVIDKMGERGSW